MVSPPGPAARSAEALEVRDAAGRGGRCGRALLLALGLLLGGASAAQAGTGGADLPWNHPLQV